MYTLVHAEAPHAHTHHSERSSSLRCDQQTQSTYADTQTHTDKAHIETRTIKHVASCASTTHQQSSVCRQCSKLQSQIFLRACATAASCPYCDWCRCVASRACATLPRAAPLARRINAQQYTHTDTSTDTPSASEHMHRDTCRVQSPWGHLNTFGAKLWKSTG